MGDKACGHPGRIWFMNIFINPTIQRTFVGHLFCVWDYYRCWGHISKQSRNSGVRGRGKREACHTMPGGACVVGDIQAGPGRESGGVVTAVSGSGSGMAPVI